MSLRADGRASPGGNGISPTSSERMEPMSIIDAIQQLVRSPRTPPAPSPATRPPRLSGRRARTTVNGPGDFPSFGSMVIAPPLDAESSWRTLNLDSQTLSRMNAADLMAYLADISPEISKALDDLILMVDPGHEWHAFRPGSEDVDTRSQAVLDTFFATLRDLYGSPKVVTGRLIIGLGLRGALFAELILDEMGRLPVDLATPDPFSARFRKISDPVRGTIWQLGQYQPGGWKDLASPTISYIPYHPFPGSPYGRPPFSAAIFTAIFLLVMLHDLRRVIQQQGYPRLDVAVAMEALLEMMPDSITPGTDEFKQWVEGAIDDVVTAYEALQPDDAYIHTDVITVNRPVGTVDTSSLGAIDGLFSALERMITRGLKTMPLLMGLQEGGSETHSNRQWELHAAGIKSIQHLLEAMMEKLLSVALRAQGLQATVQFRFAELRASEMLRTPKTEAMQIANKKEKYLQGWPTQDEGSVAVPGHEADQPAPRRAAAPPAEIVQGDGENEEPEANEDRWLALWQLEETVKEMRRQMAEMRKNGHNV